MAIVYGTNYGRPTLDLNFARNKSLIDTISGQNLVTFTRSSTGTYVDSDGLIKTASANTPRFDHNPLTGECLGLLIEESRTNNNTNSDFSDTTQWYTFSSASRQIVTETTNPSGSTSGIAKLIASSGTAAHGYLIGVHDSLNINNTLTYSIYVKKGNHRYVSIKGASADEGYGIMVFDFDTETNSGGQVTKLSNGWYRLSGQSAYRGAGSYGIYRFSIGLESSMTTGSSWNATGSEFVYLWGPQVEVGTFPTSYIPTSGSTATRSADNAEITGTNFSRWYNPARVGTLFIDRRCNSPGASNTVIAGLGGPSVFDNHIGLIGSGPQEYLSHTSWSVNMWALTGGNAAISGDRKKYAIGFSLETNGTNTAVNGVLLGTRTPSNNVISNLTLGGYATTFSRLTYYPTRLQDHQLQQLTK